MTTNNAQTQNINGSVINIGTNANASINIGSTTSPVIIHDLLRIPSTVGQDIILQEGLITCQNINTNVGFAQKILGSSITVGVSTVSLLNTNPINLNGIVYINGVPLVPWSSASSFFSQW